MTAPYFSGIFYAVVRSSPGRFFLVFGQEIRRSLSWAWPYNFSVVIIFNSVYNSDVKIALLLHLYQPVTQSEEVFRQIFEESYFPLLKKISRLKDFKLSLDLPLSLLEQIDRYGYSPWFQDVKELAGINKIEIVGSAAYHPLLSKLPRNVIEKQIILNEYGMGYYLGEKESLEGDPAILIRDVRGFFPPEVAVSERVLSVIDDLGYKWMIIDESSIPFDLNYQQKYGVYQFKDYSAKLICRNRSFSNMLSFKRDLNTDEIVDSLSFFKANNKSFAVVMDGEFFGHHYNGGFSILDELVNVARKMNIEFVTMSEYAESDCCMLLKDLTESSWGASDSDMMSGNPYPMWLDPHNKIHKKQWELLELLLSQNDTYDPFISEVEDYATLPIWNPEGLSEISNIVLRQKIAKEILFHKSLHSDQFWWASKKILPAGEYLYSQEMIEKGLRIIESYTELCKKGRELESVQEKISEIRNLMNSNEEEF